MEQPPVVQHGQVEPAAVPGNELRGVFFDAVEKTLDDAAFAAIGFGERENTELAGAVEGAGDRYRA
jgi:hypothetical protein